jgi:hypothetical protein
MCAGGGAGFFFYKLVHTFVLLECTNTICCGGGDTALTTYVSIAPAFKLMIYVYTMSPSGASRGKKSLGRMLHWCSRSSGPSRRSIGSGGIVTPPLRLFLRRKEGQQERAHGESGGSRLIPLPLSLSTNPTHHHHHHRHNRQICAASEQTPSTV